MNQDNQSAIFSIDICLRLRGSVYKLSFSRLLKWLIPCDFARCLELHFLRSLELMELS